MVRNREGKKGNGWDGREWVETDGSKQGRMERGWGWDGEGGSGREEEVTERGGRSRLGYLSRGREFLVTPV